MVAATAAFGEIAPDLPDSSERLLLSKAANRNNLAGRGDFADSGHSLSRAMACVTIHDAPTAVLEFV